MADRPNIVFLFSDQQRYDTLKCYGNDWIQTPSINALAEQSFVFRSAYVAQPVCTPARATIMTGLYPHAAGPIVNKIPLPKDVKTIAEMISEEYYCGYLGKWHLGYELEAQHGFAEWISTLDGLGDPDAPPELRQKRSSYHQHLIANGFKPDRPSNDGAGTFSSDMRCSLPEEFQMASYLGDRAAEFIERNKDRSFMLFVSTVEPHSPYDGPFKDIYDPEKLPTGPTFLKHPEGASLVNRTRADYFLSFLEGADQTKDDYMMEYAAPLEDVTTEIGWRTLRAHYMANITTVDGMVRRVTDALESAGIADNTVVVFTSEHGDMMGDHGMLEKRSFYEEASRVPLLMRVPWLSKEQTDVDGYVGQIDLVPTLLDLIGDPVPNHVQGKSLVPVMKGDQTLDGNEVFIQWNGTSDGLPDRFLGSGSINRMLTLPWRSIVLEGWKLNLCAGDQCELFDLQNDPYEETNLYNDPAQADRIRDMASRIRMWQRRTGDDAQLPPA